MQVAPGECLAPAGTWVLPTPILLLGSVKDGELRFLHRPAHCLPAVKTRLLGLRGPNTRSFPACQTVGRIIANPISTGDIRSPLRSVRRHPPHRKEVDPRVAAPPGEPVPEVGMLAAMGHGLTTAQPLSLPGHSNAVGDDLKNARWDSTARTSAYSSALKTA